MKTAKMLVLAIMVVFLADFSQAEIISREYDTSLDKTLIEYRLEKGDNPWKIYENNYPGRATDKVVEAEIMKPNGIINPRKVRVGTLIKFQIKGDATKSDVGDVSATEIPKTEMGGQGASTGNMWSNSVPVKYNSYISPDPVHSDNINYKLASANNGGQKVENDADVRIRELEEQLRISISKIEKLESEIDKLEKLTKEKDEQILSLKETGDDKLKMKPEIVSLKKEEIQGNLVLNAIVLERAKNYRIKWASITGVCALMVLGFIGYSFLKERKYDYPKKRKKKFYF